MIKNLILGMMLFSSLMPSLVSAREKLSINLGWKYHSGDIANAAAPDFDDASWQSLDLHTTPPSMVHSSKRAMAPAAATAIVL